MLHIYLVSNNPFKLDEVKEIAAPFGITIDSYRFDIRELQTTDRKRLIRHKTIEAFTKLRLPVLVDHGSLEIEALKGMPGPLTQLFWDTLEGRICDVVKALGNANARAVCTVGYCDGKKLYDDEGIVEGSISATPIGARNFQWDTIFIPKGGKQTYAEMSIPDKNAISQRKIAFEALFKRVKST